MISYSIWTQNTKPMLTINGKKNVKLTLIENLNEHFLYKDPKEKYFVTSQYSGLFSIIEDFENLDQGMKELQARVEKKF